MMEPEALLGALQLADSALPIGRFVHSHGLEAWLEAHPGATAEELAELVGAVVTEGVAPLDGAFVALAWPARTTGELCELDAALTARKLTPSARAASQAPGRQLAGLARQLVPGDARIAQLAELVQARETCGNLAIVSGALARALGIPVLDAVTIELRGAATALLSAAVRLGALAPTAAQIAVARLTPRLADAAAAACELRLDDVRCTTPELEVYALAHARARVKLFAT